MPGVTPLRVSHQPVRGISEANRGQMSDFHLFFLRRVVEKRPNPPAPVPSCFLPSLFTGSLPNPITFCPLSLLPPAFFSFDKPQRNPLTETFPSFAPSLKLVSSYERLIRSLHRDSSTSNHRGSLTDPSKPVHGDAGNHQGRVQPRVRVPTKSGDYQVNPPSQSHCPVTTLVQIHASPLSD